MRSTQSNAQTTEPSGNGWTLADGTDYNRTGQGIFLSEWPEASLVKVTATVNASLAVSGVTATGATLTLSNHAGAWWLKRTNPADATCKSMGTTTTETLTGLNPAQSYTYTAYDDSACTVALLTVTFRTLLTVSNLGETTHPSFSNEIGYKKRQRQPAVGQRLHHRQLGRRLHAGQRRFRVRTDHGFRPPGSTRKSTRIPAVCRVRW